MAHWSSLIRNNYHNEPLMFDSKTTPSGQLFSGVVTWNNRTMIVYQESITFSGLIDRLINWCNSCIFFSILFSFPAFFSPAKFLPMLSRVDHAHLNSASTVNKLNGQATPLDVSGLSQNEIQGLLLGSHPSANNTAAAVAAAAAAVAASNINTTTTSLSQQQQEQQQQQQSTTIITTAGTGGGVTGSAGPGGTSTVVISTDGHHQRTLATVPVSLTGATGTTITIKREPEDLRKEPKGTINLTNGPANAVIAGQKVGPEYNQQSLKHIHIRPSLFLWSGFAIS